jgi:hypothetical protein
MGTSTAVTPSGGSISSAVDAVDGSTGSGKEKEKDATAKMMEDYQKSALEM